MKPDLSIKRVYEPPLKEDGYRVLIDRLWPRGLSKEKASVDLWLKEIAPTSELRKWFGHDPEKWPDFRKKYRAEIESNKEAAATLRNVIQKKGKVTLLYGAREERFNDAVVLKEVFS